MLPFDGEGQVLHLRVLLFDLLDEVHDDVLQLRNQPGLSHTEVLVQRSRLFVPGRRQEFTDDHFMTSDDRYWEFKGTVEEKRS